MKGLLLKTKQETKKAGQAKQKTECYGELINPAALILEDKEDMVFDVCSLHGPSPHQPAECCASEPEINYVTELRSLAAGRAGKGPWQALPSAPRCLGISLRPAHLGSRCTARRSFSSTVIVFMELHNSFLAITLQVPEMEPCAKK